MLELQRNGQKLLGKAIRKRLELKDNIATRTKDNLTEKYSRSDRTVSDQTFGGHPKSIISCTQLQKTSSDT